jgi:hypothetical protein
LPLDGKKARLIESETFDCISFLLSKRLSSRDIQERRGYEAARTGALNRE